MSRVATLTAEFIETFPDKLTPGVIYVSIPYASVAHICCCGCGREVITPLTPTDWRLTYNGETVTLDPSVGNWSFPCRSHYVIKQGRVHWAGDMSAEQVAKVREADRRAKTAQFGAVPMPSASPAPVARKRGLVGRLVDWLSGRG